MTAASLAALLADSAAGIPGCAVAAGASSTTCALRGTVFAALDGEVAEFRLDPIVGAAARRTPDTAPSARGVEWVTFSPAILDQYGEDRARAWFAAAARRAAAD